MPENQIPDNVSTSPLWQLVQEAEEVKIEEVPSETGRRFHVEVKPRPAKPAPPPPPPTHDVPYLLKNAEILRQSGEYILARNLFSFALSLNLREPDALRGLGICLFRTGDYTSAKKCFRAFREIDGRPESHFWLAQCAIAEKNDVEAIELFRAIKTPHFLSPEDQFEMYKDLGNCLTRQRRFDEADLAYRQALNLKADSDLIYVNMGTLALQRQHLEMAGVFFQKAAKLNPTNAKAHCGIGMVCEQAGKPKEAIRAFRAAMDLDSQNLVALYQLLSLAQDAGEIADLIARIGRFLVKDQKNSDVRFVLAALLFQKRDWTSCERVVDEILAYQPQHKAARKLKDELTSNKHRL